METQTIELTENRKEQLNDQPIMQSYMYISLDGKWFVHKTIITDLKPMNYMKKVMDTE